MKSRAQTTRTRRVDAGQVSALLGPGRALEHVSRSLAEARLGHDLRDVRVHDDERAEFAARSLGARGFAFGRNVVLGAERDERLLAHELAHVVQQERRGPLRGDPETGARLAETGRRVSPEELGTAPLGLYADEEEKRPTTTEPAVTIDWETALRPGRFSLGVGPLLPPRLGGLGVAPPLLTPPTIPGGSILPPLTPTGSTPQPTPAPTSAPSRLPVATSGSFSLGLRLGFPEAEARVIPGAPASALTETLRRGELLNQLITGQVPRGWDTIDKAQLASAVWGIFSTHIAPDVARRITSGLSASPGKGGPTYQLDLVLLTNFSGGGLSFSVTY